MLDDRWDVFESGGSGLAVPLDAGLFGTEPFGFEASGVNFALKKDRLGAVGAIENLATDALDFGAFLAINGYAAGHYVEAMALLLVDLEGARGQFAALYLGAARRFGGQRGRPDRIPAPGGAVV